MKYGGEGCSISIEDMCFQYLKSRNGVKEEQATNQKNFKKTIENEGSGEMRVKPTIENVTIVSVDVKSKEKKQSIIANGAYEQAIEETLTKPAEHPGEIPSSLPIEPTKMSKDKKKQHEDASKHLDKDVQEKQSEVFELNVETKKKREKKVKKERNGIKMEENLNGYINHSSGTIEAGEKKKESKKRKKQPPEGSGADDVEEATFDDSKRRKTNDSDISNKIAQPPKSPNGFSNGVLEKDGTEKSQKQDKPKELNGSAEPSIAKAFQRVKPEDVEFADERLQDNSYWAKDGADSGYGAKAQEVLGQVRGRDFRHEKTKKKRGSYRGGQIDLRTHSVKFNYEDDDE
ncbi:hypothetical protein KSS87_017155 [Heliosperma pusillum]|nr:hypothetical protein KSS87_017155 [Heliosperma pusillum]